jgi:hypothetical protein
MARFYTANDIINRAALECGVLPSSDPIGSTDEVYVQLSGLLNSAGQELIELHPWQGLRKKFSFTTQAGDTGSYPLPDDFSYMVDQTGWDRTSRLPVGGPISSQMWAFLDGSTILEGPLYAIFQLLENKLQLYPRDPVPAGINISFLYQSRNWAQAQNTQITDDKVTTGSDLVMFEPILMIKFLKAMFLSAKGFDSSTARAEFERMFLSRTGKDEGAQILSASGGGLGIPLISNANAPWTGYGL